MQEGAAAATERDAISEFLQTECVGHLQYVMQERLMPMTTPKIHALLKKLRQYHDKPQFRGIVFVDRRCVAHCAPVRLRLKRTNDRSRDVSCRVVSCQAHGQSPEWSAAGTEPFTTRV